MQINLAAYTKAGSLSYTSPKYQRFFTAKAKRLIRLARRIHDGRLFLPEIVTALREAANQLIALGAFLLLTEKASAFLDDLFWITSAQLRQALTAQKSAGAGRLGQWLVRQQGVSEQLVTRALGMQWSCPVLPLELHDAEALTGLVPRLFLDAFGALPLRVAAGKLLYLGFADRLDPVLALAVERMSGLRVESGLVAESLFGPAHSRMLNAKFPPVELIEAGSEPALVYVLAKSIEQARPVASRLVRVHDCLWLRMWLRRPGGPAFGRGAISDSSQNSTQSSTRDLICSVGAH